MKPSREVLPRRRRVTRAGRRRRGGVAAVRVIQGFVLGAAIVAVVAATVLEGRDAAARRAPGASATAAADGAQVLLEQHRCWAGEAPADMVGVVPGDVVVVLPDGRAVLGGKRLVGQALEQVFEDRDHGLSVKGFCR